uniref:Protein phyllopod n=1 Tax=Bactrocera dorsalis TaxID=27457 RepID=A0A034WS66_BACDO
MSEISSEFLKRTCLICGCHTNQTINIYEPRSGPNIVELIQAKFKFQPLSDDKYLCFSCNNWLINWYSLQTLNSNDAESPSGNFRLQMNSMMHKENAENQHPQSQNMSHWQTNTQLCRPIAKVLPNIKAKARYDQGVPLQEESFIEERKKCAMRFQPKCCDRLWYSIKQKMPSRSSRLQRKLIKHKTFVGHRTNLSIKTESNCEEINVADAYKENPKEKCLYIPKKDLQLASEITNIGNNENIFSKFDEHAIIDNERWLKRPLIDGKVVSMLRRLGTTLSHNVFNKSTNTSRLLVPQIMSPIESKPRWTRQLDDDEIVLHFNSAISEVLPQVIEEDHQKLSEKYHVPEIMAVRKAKRKLTYQVSVDKDVSQSIYPVLPEGLSISLV